MSVKITKKTEPCFGCAGTGEQTIIVHTRSAMQPRKAEDKGVEHRLSCIHCNGSGRVAFGAGEKYRREFDEFWCKGHGEKSVDAGLIFHDDGECGACDKHHYHCPICGKIAQVG